MFETLFAKTFLILSSQLVVTLIGALVSLAYVRALYKRGAAGITAKTNKKGELDLEVDWSLISGYFWALLAADIGLFLVLLFWGTDNLTVGIPVFTMWSILTGIEMALCLISVDENLGAKVLGLTVLATVAAALVGIYSGIDFSFLRGILFLSLSLLIIFGFVRIFSSISRGVQKVGAFAGVVIFIGYLLYDFERLKDMEEAGTNTWNAAMDMSISIYLDIINLFLDLLDLLSD